MEHRFSELILCLNAYASTKTGQMKMGWQRLGQVEPNIPQYILTNLSSVWMLLCRGTFCAFGIFCMLQSSVLPQSCNKDTKTIPISENYFDFNLCVNKIFGLTKKRLFIANYVFHVISLPGSSVNCRVLIHFWPMNMNGAIILKHNTFVLSHFFQMCLKARGKST